MVWTWVDTLKLLCCGVAGRDKGQHHSKHVNECNKVKIRVGFDGKDTLIHPADVNVKTVFGSFAVLLDSDNQVVPLRKDGFSVVPLVPGKHYVVVLNTHGSSKLKWDIEKKEYRHKHKLLHKQIFSNNHTKHHHHHHDNKKLHHDKKEVELHNLENELTTTTPQEPNSKLEQILIQIKEEINDDVSLTTTKTDNSSNNKSKNNISEEDRISNNYAESSCIGIGVDENQRERESRDNFVPFLSQDFSSTHNLINLDIHESTATKERLLGTAPLPIFSRAIASF